MDKEELQKNIALYYSKLPPNLQSMFSSMSWLETLKRISAKYSLDDKQIETLGTETTLVLLGIIHPEEYEEVLKKELGLPEGLLNNVLLEVNSLIINAFRPEITETFTNNNTPDNETAKTDEKLDERFEKMPKDVKSAVVASNYHNELYKIGQKHNLSIPEMGTLEESTTSVMLGVVSPEGFEGYLKKNLNLPDDTIKAIVSEINEKILKNIRNIMMTSVDTHAQPATPPVNKQEAKVLDTAGIKIIEPNLNALEISAPKKADGEVTHPILGDKLSVPFKARTVSTEHSLGNISKEKTAPAPTKNYPPKKDPYRLSPDE